MRDWLKISHHRHSGRLRPHEHTSYLPLTVLVAFVGVLLAVYSLPIVSSASTPYTGPEAGSVSVTGTLPKPPPKTAATIAVPRQGQHFATSPITVAGTCPQNTIVEVYKNDIFAGSAPCSDEGKYEVQVDLLFGQNVLVARVYDVLNQAGPDSNSVTVFYDALPSQSAALSVFNFSDHQLLLSTDAVYRGIFPDQQLNVPISIIGGSAPYALNVQWGDLSNKVIPRGDNLVFNASHVYKKPGTYQISLQASDSHGAVAFLTVAAIVNGQPAVLAASGSSKTPVNKLLVLWPVYAATITIVISFWLGERREKRVLIHAGAV
jgi:hypothetical protein